MSSKFADFAPGALKKGAGLLSISEPQVQASSGLSVSREETARAWIDSTLFETEQRTFITAERTCANAVTAIDKMMAQLARTSDPLFWVETTGLRSVVKKSMLGEEFVRCLNHDLYEVRSVFPWHQFSPYFQLFEAHTQGRGFTVFTLSVDTLGFYTATVDSIRAAAKGSPFTKTVKSIERSVRRNTATASLLLERTFERFSVLLAVRVELYYHWSKSYCIAPWAIREHRKEFLRLLRERYPSLAGYVWSQEAGNIRGPHCHFMALFSGHLVRRDAVVGRGLAEIWAEATEGMGWAWNCNARKARYASRGTLGIGAVARTDHLKRANLLYALTYLTKRDLYIRLMLPGLRKTFGTSYIAEPGKPRLRRRNRKRKVRIGPKPTFRLFKNRPKGRARHPR